MQLVVNKDITFKFIHKCKSYNLRCLYAYNLFDKIPIFVSNDVEDIMLINENRCIIPIVNNDFINKKDDLTLSIMSILIRYYYKYINDNNIDEKSDMCLSQWFGFKQTIEFLDKSNKYDNENIKRRISLLNELYKLNSTFPCPNIDSVINSFNYIVVN